MRPGIRNSWRPVLRGELVAEDDGCRLVGKLGVHPAVRAFCAVWLTLVLSFCAIGLAIALSSAVAGRFRSALGGLAFSGAALLMLGFFVGLTTFSGRWGHNDEAYLQGWLRENLQSSTPI
jgi:hypothetical protein